MFLFADTLPEPISQQHLVECTLDYETGNGTEMFRANKGCDFGFTDVHLIWLQSEGQTIKTALDYPLTPEALGECKNDILNNIRKREVSYRARISESFKRYSFFFRFHRRRRPK